MTEKEIIEGIIKGLDYCIFATPETCKVCPYYCKDIIGCSKMLMADAQKLINRQKAEIEELTEKHHSECRQIAEYDDESKLFADIGKLYSEIRTETVKKFAEALKAELKNLSKVHLFGATFALVGESFIDGFVAKYEKGK